MIVNLEILSVLVDQRSMASRAQGDAAEGDRLETEAMDLQREALRLRRASSKEVEPSIGEVLVRLAGILERRSSRLLQAGELTAAAPFFRESLQLLEEEGQTDSRRVADLQCRLGRCLMALERFPEAEAFLLGGYRIFEGDLGGKSASVQMAANALIELYEKWNRPAEARRYRSLLTSPTVLAIQELGPLQFPGKNVSSLFRGRHGGYSARFSGRSLWTFNFSIAEPECETNQRFCSGSWSWTDDLDASGGIGAFSSGTDQRGFPAEPIPYTEDEAAYNRAHRGEDCIEDCRNAYYLQPLSLVSDPARGRALAFYQKRLGPDILFDAARQGTSIAVWTDPTQRAVRPAAGGTVTELFSAEEPAWGSAAVVVDDLLYAYACKPDQQGCPVLVARVPLAHALDRQAWRFYAGDRGWSANWREAIPVTDCAGYLSVHWNGYLGRYLASHVVPGIRAIALRTADRPRNSPGRVDGSNISPTFVKRARAFSLGRRGLWRSPSDSEEIPCEVYYPMRSAGHLSLSRYRRERSSPRLIARLDIAMIVSLPKTSSAVWIPMPEPRRAYSGTVSQPIRIGNIGLDPHGPSRTFGTGGNRLSGSSHWPSFFWSVVVGLLLVVDQLPVPFVHGVAGGRKFWFRAPSDERRPLRHLAGSGRAVRCLSCWVFSGVQGRHPDDLVEEQRVD
jgi:hypothetical protein